MADIQFPSQRKSTPLNQIKSMRKENQQSQEQNHQHQHQQHQQQQHNQNNEHYDEVESEMEQIIDEEVYNNEQRKTYDESVINTIPYEMKKDLVLQNLCNIDDVQLFVIVVVVFLLVQILPIKRVLEKCVAIDRIPYGDYIAKAFISGIIIFITMKLTRA
jgi:hypothetical protein